MTEDTCLGLTFDYPHYFWHGKPFVPKIFDAGPSENVPQGFNAVRVCLDGTMKASLDWRQAAEVARHYSQEGLALLWDLDLGLFDRLPLSLSDSSQLQALRLALKHFCDTLWPEFASITLGIAVFRGCADFSHLFPWDSETREHLHQASAGSDHRERERLFCRDCCAEYLASLCAGLPGNLQPYLILDANRLPSPRDQLHMLNRAYWSRFHLIVGGACVPVQAVGWEKADAPLGYFGRKSVTLKPPENVTLGLCLPSEDSTVAVDRALQWLLEQGKPYRVIPEDFLTAEWDGLDELIILSDPISPVLQRKLEGFKAAGGQVRRIIDLLTKT